MGLLANLWKLVGPTLPSGFCPTTFQELSDAIINGTQVTFLIDTGNSLYNYGSATPAPENRIFPWLNTDDGLWYNFKFGLWTTPVNPTDLEPDFRKIWLPPPGTLESAAWALDGGSGTDPTIDPPTSFSGAFWQVDHTMDGRFPLGAGTIPNSDLGTGLAQVGINQIADSFGREGEYAHTLTADEGAVAGHTHPFGVADPASDDAFFSVVGPPPITVPTYNAHFVTGSGHGLALNEVTANLYTLKANDGNGVTSIAHNTMPGYRAVWFLKHTVRQYRTRPA